MLASVLAWLAKDPIWSSIGFLGQGLFASRFLIQWYYSEREGRSVIPVAFWYFSLIGGIVTTAYMIHLQSIPLIIGQGSGLFVYARNLYLIQRERTLLKQAATQPEPGG
jgi:lipid-A-disaccharide synthase-like uncharacterized protein